nr:MAG: hypothetical protein [Chemarfal virus 8]
MTHLTLVNASCNSCHTLAKSYLSVIDESNNVGNQLIDKFEVSVGVRNYQGVDHLENPAFGSIPPSRDPASDYFIDLLSSRDEVFIVGPDNVYYRKLVRGPYYITLVRNLGFGSNNVIAFTSTIYFDRFKKLMHDLAVQGHMALPLHVSYS